MARVDYTDRAKEYSRARTLPPAVLAPWRTVLAQIDFFPTRVVLDLGAGTGGFLEPLHEWFAAPVIAIEPSEAMRRESALAGLTSTYPHVAAWAESLPLRSESIDVAWLSTVIHQFEDRDTAAGELHRVIRPGGRVLVRGFLSDVPITGLFSMFPGIERSAESFPSTDSVVSSFESAGFTLDRVTDVVEPWEFDLVAWTERVRSVRHIDSGLRPLTDTEFDKGLRVVTEAFSATNGPIASDGTLRLVVLRK